MTAPGPLARKLAEVEADLLVARDNARHFKAELDRAEEGKDAYFYTYGQHRADHHANHTCPEDDWKACIRDAGLARIEELEAENRKLHAGYRAWMAKAQDMDARAVRYAEALQFNHGHALPLDGCKPDKYTGCEAVRWLAERAP